LLLVCPKQPKPTRQLATGFNLKTKTQQKCKPIMHS